MSTINLYTDASFDEKHNIAGWGVLAFYNSDTVMNCGSEKNIPGSVAAEMIAVHCGISLVLETWINIRQIDIRSDCDAVIYDLQKCNKKIKKDNSFFDVDPRTRLRKNIG